MGGSSPIPETPEVLDLDQVRIDPELARRVPESLATRRGVLLFGRQGEDLVAACLDPEDDAALEAVERAAGARVIPVRADPASLERALARVFARRPSADGDEAVQLVDELMHDAVLEQASDIHVEPDRDTVRIRFRVDGELETRRQLPPSAASALINRIKVLSGLDIAEKRAPQDGRFTWDVTGDGTRAVDVRVGVLPTKEGERATLRLLALKTESLTLERIGMDPKTLGAFRAELARPHGMILLTGPTGSGKSTTLYAALREIDVDAKNVLTIEDPVEYSVPGVSQTEIESTDRVTFHKALRSMLRHDPDVLMIGEIRDQETADVAVKASLTGHLVFSTLHTNSAVSAVTRLLDMGTPAYLAAATLRLVVAQRLVRRLCVRCRVERLATPAERDALGLADDAPAFDPGGCMACRGSGFSGRVGLFETFRPDRDLQGMIARGCAEGELLSAARERGLSTLREDAAIKVVDGVTPPDEALRAVEVH